MKRYPGGEIEVAYDPVRCLHAAESVYGLPSVFDTSRRRWVQPDGAAAEVLASVIERCPTGALDYTLSSGPAEEPVVPTRIRFPEDGPMLLRSNLDIDGMAETRAALCCCEESANQPYCDRSWACRDRRYQSEES